MPSPQILATSLSPCNVLVCDDCPDAIDFISALTKLFGCDVTTARNGKEALHHCHTGKFDVILMDLVMPVLSGLEAARTIISTDNPNKTTPIIAITLDSDPIIKAGCACFGINYYITKPINKTQLYRVISECKNIVDFKL